VKGTEGEGLGEGEAGEVEKEPKEN